MTVILKENLRKDKKDNPRSAGQRGMNNLKNTEERLFFFSQIVATQLCHDMASPIGSLLAGVEMLSPTTTPEDQEIIDLLHHTARLLKNRFDVSRAALASGSQTLGARQAKTLISEYFSLHEKISLSLDWPLDSFSFPKGTFQLLMNILLWMTPKAPKGGHLKIIIPPTPPFKIGICFTAPMIFIRPDDEDLIHGKVPLAALQPQMMHPYFIYLLSKVFHHSLDIQKLSFEELSLCVHLAEKDKKIPK